jgi:hypothetical protein
MLPPAWIAPGARWRDHAEEREALARRRRGDAAMGVHDGRRARHD